MTADTLSKSVLFKQLDETTDNFVQLIAATDAALMDVVPFEKSWTVAQLASHVTKSVKGIAQALEMKGEPARRNAAERIEELKKIFLDYNAKYNSPEFILPTKTVYSKEEIIARLNEVIKSLKTESEKNDLSEVISLPTFGEITKLELLYFVLFHTTRHTYQLKNVLHILNNKN